MNYSVLTITTAVLLAGSSCADSSHQEGGAPRVESQNLPSADKIRRIIQPLFRELDEDLDQEIRDKISRIDIEGMAAYHKNLGRYIRNHYGLWSGETGVGKVFHDVGITHADAASEIILNEYWRHLNHKPSNLDHDVSSAIATLESIRKYLEDAADKEILHGTPRDPFEPIQKPDKLRHSSSDRAESK